MYICEYLYGHTGNKLDPHDNVQCMHVLIKKKRVLAYTRMNGNYLTFYNNIP